MRTGIRDEGMALKFLRRYVEKRGYLVLKPAGLEKRTGGRVERNLNRDVGERSDVEAVGWKRRCAMDGGVVVTQRPRQGIVRFADWKRMRREKEQG
jgi:hypothetical protein